MRIASIESWVGGSLHVVRITDEEGVRGHGQSAFWAYPEATEAVINVFSEYLVGREADHINDHWHALYRMGPFRGAPISAAVGAVDMALWDLKARRADKPVFEMYGGRLRDRVRLHKLILGWSSLNELAEEASIASAEGFTAVKFDPMPSGYENMAVAELTSAIVDAMSVVREEIGPRVDVILELHRSLSPVQAATVLESLAELRPLFVEDPLQIDSIATQAELARQGKGTLGQGERLTSMWEVRELLESGGPQVVRTDIALAGGISHALKIAAVAESYSAPVCWHTFSGPIVSAAATHVDLSIPNVLTQEWWPPVDEPGALKGFISSIQREGGWILAPKAPGLGVDFDEEAFEPFHILGRPVHEIPRRFDGSVSHIT